MIEARGLTVDYPRSVRGAAGAAFDRALHGLDLSVPRGSSLAVVGPSGCGKSTLLYAVAGLVPTAGGSLRVDGRPAVGRPGTALVFQDYGLFPWKTALQNVELGFRTASAIRGRSDPAEAGTRGRSDPAEAGIRAGPGAGRRQARDAIRDRAQALLERFGVGRLADKYPSELSGGERQRTAIARALAGNPDLLLLDEPSSSLDALSKESFQRAVLGLCSHSDSPRTLTVVLVTHDIEEAAFLGSSVAVMERGRIRAVLENPLFGDPSLRDRLSYYEFCLKVRRLLGGGS
ncbi:MAG: ATP-binding cassette domain-containing protein [Treponema sp.]|nr:ATP-binding cassette domain-containing protein [Treponema sp.]